MKKKKQKKSLQKLTIASRIGWGIVCLVFAIAGIYAVFFDLNAANRKVVAVFVIVFGIGLFLTAPKALDDFEEGNTSDSRGLFDVFFPIIFGGMSFVCGFRMLLE